MRFLATLIVQALSRANEHQTVGFEATQPSIAGPIKSGGILFIHGISIHLTLTRYRCQPDSGTTVYRKERLAPDSNRLDQRRVLFTFATVLEPAPPKPGLPGLRHLTTLVIDAHILWKMPETVLSRHFDDTTLRSGDHPSQPGAKPASLLDQKDN